MYTYIFNVQLGILVVHHVATRFIITFVVHTWYICTYKCTYVCMYVCMYVHVCMLTIYIRNFISILCNIYTSSHYITYIIAASPSL